MGKTDHAQPSYQWCIILYVLSFTLKYYSEAKDGIPALTVKWTDEQCTI